MKNVVIPRENAVRLEPTDPAANLFVARRDSSTPRCFAQNDEDHKGP